MSAKTLKIFLFFTLIFCVGVVPAQAGLKVQKGETTIVNGQTSVTVNITAVSDLSRAMLLMWSSGDSGTDWGEAWQATGYLSSTSQIAFERVGTRDDCQIGYYVVEAENQEFEVIDRGLMVIGAENTMQDTDISQAIDQAHTAIIASSMLGDATGNDDEVHKGFATVHFVDNDTIRATRGASGTYSCDVRYQVVQWLDIINVQSKEFSSSISTTELTQSIDTPVTATRTWLYATASHSGGSGISQVAVDTYLKDGSTVGFRRRQGTYSDAIRWWAIEFPSDVSVQHVSGAAATGDLTVVTPISAVTIANSWSDVYNNCNGTGQALPRQAFYTQITSTTQVTNTRYYSGQAADLSVEVIDTAGWTVTVPTVNITVTPNITKSQTAGNLEIKLVFSESMNPSVSPVVMYDPAGTTGAQSCTGGTWSTTTYSNDTYTVYNDAAIDEATGDGIAAVSVSGAKSVIGVIMTPDTNDTFVIDTAAPANPGAPCNAWESSAKITSLTDDTWQENDDTPYFEWAGASDSGGSGVSGYSVYWGNDPNGVPAATQEQTAANFDVTAATGDGVFFLRVRTFDNASNYSDPVTLFTFRYDAGAPTNPNVPCDGWQTSLKLDAISNDTWQESDDTPYFEWTGANDAGGSGVSGYSVYWGTDPGGEPGITQAQGNADYEVTTPTGDGTYYLRVRTFDNVNHYSAPVTLFTFHYDATAPSNPNTPCNAWDSSSKNTVVSDNIPQGADDTPYFEWTGANDGNGQGVSGYSVYLGTNSEGEPGTTQEQSGASYDVTASTGAGTFYLRVRTFDSLGHYSEPTTLFTFIYDETKPTMSIGVLPDPAGHRAVGELAFILIFSESMDTGTIPVVTYDPAGSTGLQSAATNGSWSTTNNNNDTYTVYNSSAINSSTGDGIAAITISAAKDIAGNTMLDDTNDTFTIDTSIDHFVIIHDGSTLINTPEDITVIAKNITNCTITDFTGQITLSTLNETGEIAWALQTGNGTFADNGVGNDTATYTFNASDNGEAVFQLTSSTTGSLDVEATDGSHSDDDTEGALVVSTYALASFVISHDGAGIAGTQETITVTAKNTNGQTKTDYIGTITLDTNGTATTVSWTKVTGNGIFSDAGALLDTATYTFHANDQGVAVFTVKDTKAETINLAVNDGGVTDDNTEGNLVISPAVIHHFTISHDTQAVAGAADNVTVTAGDVYNNTKTNYTGTITLDTNGTAAAITWAKVTGNGSFNDGGASVDTATYTFNALDNGVVVLSITDTKAESIDIDASGDGKTDTDTEGNMVVSAAGIDYFIISHDGAAAAGVSEQITVTAKDAYANTKTNYAGTITMDTNGTATTIGWAKVTGNGTFDDGGASVDTATYTFDASDNGVVVFSLMDTTSETINISVSGDGKTDNNTEGNLVVGAPVIWSFLISHDNAGNAGVAETVTITAKDSIGGIKTDYTGTITIDTSGTATAISWAKVTGNGSFNDGGASVDTAIYTFSASDNGVVTLSITDSAVESIDIDVTGSGKSDDDSEGNMIISPALLDHFHISHDGQATAGTTENITITAINTLGQTKTDYTGQITVDTTGSETKITWSLQTGNGTFNDGGVSADTCTYTFTGSDNGVVVLAFNDTASETLNISVSGDAKYDDDTEGDLTVKPGTLNNFVISHDNNAFTDKPEHITISAYDSYSNIKTDYTGQITVDTNGTAATISWALYLGSGSFVDGGASVDTATYTYAAADAGVVTLNITDSAAETINISVSGGGKTDDNTEGDLVITQFLLGDWTYHKEVLINHSQVTATLSNFPVLVSIVDTGLRDYARSDGYDIVFTASDGNTKLDHEIERFDKATGTLVAWVRIPSLSSAVDTKTYMYYGNSSASDQQNVSGVWESNYKGIWHLHKDPSGTAPQESDSSSNNNNMTSSGSMTAGDLINGKIGKAIDFDGVNDYFIKNSPVGLGTPGDYTISGWFSYTSSPANYGTVYSHNTYTPQFGFYNQSVAMVYHSALITSSGTATHNDGQWHKVDYRRVGSTVYFYVDGQLHGTGSHTRTFPTATRSMIGWSYYSNEYWRGQLDEIRYATVARSPEWIATEYNNQSSPGTFISVGLAATATANPVTTDAVPAGQTGNIILNVTVSNNEGSQITVNSVTINNTGTAADNEIPAVKLYYDSNNSLDYTAGVDTQVGNGVFSSGSKVFSGFNINMPAYTTEYLFAILDVSSSCASGKILDAAIPIDGIVFSNGKKLDNAVLNSSGTRLTYIALDHFVISHDGGAVSGMDENIIITAKDAYGNTKTDYTGTITVDTSGTASAISWSKQTGSGAFNDGGAGVDTATYTFSSQDNGVVVLNVNDTKAETINISVSGDGKTDDNTEADLVVSAGLIDHFVIVHDGAAAAGDDEAVSVTAKDNYENTITNYTGQITLDTNGTAEAISWALSSGFGTFNDGGASVDTATYTFSASDNGVAAFMVTDNQAETINIFVSGDGKTDDDTEGNMVVSPGALDYFVIEHDSSANSGTPESVTVTAKDVLGNIKTDYIGTITLDTNGTATTIGWAKVTGNGTFNDGGASVDTATYTFVGTDNGTAVFTITDTKKETINIAVSGDTKTDDNTEGDLVVAAGDIDYFVIAHDGTATTGVSENVTITAYDAQANVKDDYTGQITVDTNGTATTIFWTLLSGEGSFADGGEFDDTATYTFATDDSGVVNLSIINYTAETTNISVSGDGKTDDNTEGDLAFIDSGIHHFLIVHDGNAISGIAENVSIYAKDANNITLTNYQGQITVDTTGTAVSIVWAKVTGNGTFTDGGAEVDTCTYSYSSSDNGVVVLTIIDTTEETLNISVSGEGKTDNNTEGDLVINPAGLHHFTISHDANANAGVADAITITAKNANNNTITNYTGQIVVDTTGTATAITWAKQTGSGSFSEGGPAVDTATYTYVAADNGVCVLTITDTKVETINISVSGGGKSDDNTEGNLVVASGAIDHFVIIHDGTATAGIADNVTIRAEDAYNNVKANYTGQITVDTNGTAGTITWAKVTGSGTFVDGGAAVDTATYNFAAADNGQCILSINDITAQSLNISVTGDGKTDNDAEGNLIVKPTVIHHFTVSHDNTAEAGIAEQVTVTAYDTYSNIKDDYTGTITLDTSGTAAMITWAKVTGSGTFVDGGASVDTATYTYADADDGIVVLTITDTKKESIDIDAAGSGKTDNDTEGNLAVGPTIIHHFVIVHDGSAEAGIADNITITAYDTYSNIKDNYTGQITVDTNGTENTITWAKVTGSGTFVDGGTLVDTATYTYADVDDGVVILSINDSKSESVNISVTGDGKSDTNTEGVLVIGAGAIDHFTIFHDGSAIISVAESVTIYAKDSFGNTKNNYTGQITVDTNGTAALIAWALSSGSGTFQDGGAGVDTATYTFSSSDAGIVILTVTDSTEETINITVSGDGKTDDNTEGNLVVNPVGGLNTGYLSPSANSGSFTNPTYAYANDTSRARSSNTLTHQYYNYGNNIPAGSTIMGIEVKLDAYASTTSGLSQAQIELSWNAGTNFTTTGKITPDMITSEVTYILGGPADTWGRAWTLSELSNANFRVRMLAQTSGSTSYIYLDWIPVKIYYELPPDAAANAVTTNSVSAGQSNALILDVTVTSHSAQDKTISSVTVNNTGTASDAEISAVTLYYDSNNSGDYNSGIDNQVGTGTFTSGSKTFSGLSITLPASGTENLYVVCNIANTINEADTIDVQIPVQGITFSYGVQIEDTILNSSGTRAVSLVLDHFVLSHDGAASTGVPEPVSVTVKDAYNNTKTAYSGTITLDTNGTATAITWAKVTGSGTFNDGGASVDTATYTFSPSDNGTAVFNITDSKAETINISVSGGGKTDDNTEGDLAVSAGILDHFKITHDTAAVAGAAETITVTAKDAYNNTVSNYIGQITLDTSGTAASVSWALTTGFGVFADGGAGVDTAIYTFNTADNSQVTFSLTDITAETINISVSGDGKNDDDTEGNLIISAAALDHFLIMHDASAEAGVAENITITAKDQYENTKQTYTGQITVDTNGTATAITWAKVTGSGTFVDGGVDADTAIYTYNISDSGVVLLSITDVIMENLNIAVSGNGKSDNDTEGVLAVGPGLIDHFTISHDGLAMQNQTENITIKAYDAYNNQKTNYIGQITVDTDGTAAGISWALVFGSGIFNDGGTGVDTAVYTYSGADNGEVILSINDATAEIINISVSGDGKTDDDNEGILEIVAAGFHHFKITHDGNAVAEVPEQVTVTAKDVNDITVTNYAGTMSLDTDGTAVAIGWALVTGNGSFADDGASVDTAEYTFVAADNGVVVLTITDSNQETINISASGSGKTDDNSEGNLTVNPAGVHHFVIAHDGAAIAGIVDNMSITAHDANHAVVTNYAGTITVDTTGTAGTITWSKITGSGIFNDGGAAVDTAQYTFVSGDNGAAVLGIIDTTAEIINISVSDSGKTDDDTEGNLTVAAAGIDHFMISHDGAAEAGIAENITIYAKDEYNNSLLDYIGQITVDTNGTANTITWAKTTGNGAFSDGGASVDTATYTYAASDDGVVVLNVIDTTVEIINVSVSGDGKSDDNTEGNLNIGSGALNKFVVVHDGSATAGIGESVTVTAYDIYGNIKTNYTGQITVDTNGTANAVSWALSSGAGSFNDGGALVDTATYTYAGVDNGTVTFAITDTKAETIDIDISGNGKFDDDTEGNMIVSPAGLYDFKITHDGNAVAGAPEDISIYAKDEYDNNITGYTGQITVDTNGTETAITWALVTGNGVFNDNGASADTATYTFNASDSGQVILSINDLAAETINISASGNGKYDDDTEGNLIVNPGALEYFVITHDGSAIQSIGEEITVTSKDAQGNTKTNYTGTITLDTNGDANNISWVLNTGSGTFNDNGASVDTATYTFVSLDNGTAVFEISDATAETINISVSGDAKSDDNTEGDLVVQASSTTVDAAANALTTNFIGQGTNNHLVLDLTLTNNNVLNTDTLQSIIVNNGGTIADNQVAAVKLYYDSNNSGDYTSGVDNQLGNGTFSAGTITFNNINVVLAAAGTEEIFVTIDLAGTVTHGVTVDASIPVNGLNFVNAPNAEDTILNSSGIYNVDSSAPSEVSNLTSSSHNNAIGAWNDPQSRDNTVYVSWTPASDSGIGLDGYSVLWDSNPLTLPDTIKDIEESVTSQTSAVLSDGMAHYFHIRSTDGVGNWDDTATHIGPFYIDITAPSSVSLYQIVEYAGNDYLHVSGSAIYYSGLAYSAFRVFVDAADGLSGLNRGVFPTTTSAGGTDNSEEGGAYEYVYTYEITSSGADYNNVNVTIYDNAGNNTTVPFSVKLDNTAPNNVASLTSSTHTSGVASPNNDITFNWSDVSDSESGLAGYSILVDTGASTLPAKFKNVNSGVGTYIKSDLANGTYYAHIRAMDNVGNWTASATHSNSYSISRGKLSAVIAGAQSVVSTGQNFIVTMTVNNTGGSAVNSVGPSTLTVSATGLASASTSSNPTAQDINTSGQKQYQWTYTAGSSSGTLNFQGYAQGTDQEGTITSDIVKSADILVEKKAALTVSATATPATVSTNETINIIVTVANSGQADALSVIPSLTPSGTASPVIDTGPSPASAPVKGGSSKQFTFTAHGTAAGTAIFTANLTAGTDENSGNNLTVTNSQDSVTVEAPVPYELTVSLSASPSVVSSTDTITVTMNVQNTGANSISNIAPTNLGVGGSSTDAIYVSGPVPANAASLASGTSQNFIWTYTAGSTAGTIIFGGKAVGTEVSSANTSSAAILIQLAPSSLTSSISATPSSLLTQATITVTMTVTNTAIIGGATAESVTPSTLTLSGTSSGGNLISGPVPASAHIIPTKSQNFIWTYKAGVSAGTVSFSGNANGIDQHSDNVVSSSSSGSNSVTVGTLSPDWIYPTGANATGPIRSVPIAYWGYNNYIYFGSDDKNMYIINGDTHELVSAFTSSGEIRGLPYPSTEGSDDIIYFGTLGSTVYSLWADNTLKWERVIGEPLSTAVLYDYVSGIYFGTTGQKAYCLDSADGSDAWASPASVGGAIESSPAMVFVPTLDYDEIYFGASDGKIYAFKAADGTGARSFDTGFGETAAIKTAPIISNQEPGNTSSRRLLFFGTGNGKFYAVNTSNLSASTAETGWTTNPVSTGGAINSAPWADPDTDYVYFGCQDGKLYALSLADGSMKANFPVNLGSPIDCWPLIENRICYVGADDGKFYAVNVDTGEVVAGWPYDTGAPIKGGASLHLIYDTETWDVIDVYVIVGSDSGRLYAFKAVQ
ncbi:MAG: DUF2341 domain-containing protein [Candidatus Omnitrophota bacterium]